MVRRFSVCSSMWLLCGVLFLICGNPVSAQSSDTARVPSQGGSPFVVAPSIMITASPTGAAVGDLRGDGHDDLVLTRAGSGAVTVLLGDGHGGFASRTDYAAGAHPEHLLLADLTGQGHMDVVAVDSAAGTLVVLPGNGDGTLSKAVAFPAITNPVAVALGNFGGKGKMDVVVAGPSSAAVLLNDGNGHFSAPVNFMLDRQPLSIASGDLDGSGHDGIVLANQDGSVSVYPGVGAGHFRIAPPISVASGPLSSIAVADLAHSGHLDLVVTHANANLVTVLHGKGDGTFQPGSSYTVGNGPASVLAVDLKRDGALDLVTVNKAANTFSVLNGNGDGTFGAARDYVAGNLPVAAVVGNFSGTGKVGLAIVNSGDLSVSMPAPNGDGTFQAARSYGTAGLERKAVASGDLNGDGLVDLVVTNFCGSDATCKSNGTASILLGNADHTYRLAGSVELGSGPVDVKLASLSGSKKLDLIAVNRQDKTLLVLAGNGDGTFSKATTYSLSGNPTALLAGAFTGSGKVGVAVTTDCGQASCAQPGNLELWLGHGDGTLTQSAILQVGYAPASIAGGDLRGTGHMDLVVANACGQDSTCKSVGSAAVLLGDGTGKFAAKAPISIGSSPASIALAQLNGSRFDLVVAQRGSGTVAVMAGDGKGGFGAAASYSVGSLPTALAIGNFTGHGTMDVAVANFGSSTVSLLANNGNGTLKPAVTNTVGTGPESLAVISSSKSGPASLVTANGNTGAHPMGSDISLLLRPMLGSSTATVVLTSGTSPSNVDDAVLLTAAVSGGGGTPTGTVTFAIDNGGGSTTSISDCGNPVTLVAGTASCTTQQLPAGSLNLIANYAGDATYAIAASVDVSQTVNSDSTTTAVGTIGAGTVGQSVSITATVSPSQFPLATPADGLAITGNVAFSQGGSSISGCSAQPVSFVSSNGTATANCTTSSFAAGNYTVKATYVGDANFATSTDATGKSLTVAAAPSTVSFSTTTSSTVAGAPASFSASVAPNVGTATVPFTGNFKFYDGATLIGTLASNSSGTAAFSYSALAVGSHTHITATYANDANYTAAAASGSVSVTVAKAGTTTAITTPLTANVNGPLTLNATVSADSPSAGTSVFTFAGTMTFKDGTTTICNSVGVSSTLGTSNCPITAVSGGLHKYTAIYSGDANYSSDTSAEVDFTPSAAGTTTVLASSQNPSIVDASVTMTATVAPVNPPTPVSDTQTISGTVTFYDGSTIPANAVCSGKSVTFSSTTGMATATCATSSLTAAASPHSLTAVFTSGDSNYSTSTSSALPQTVNKANTTTAVSSIGASSNLNQNVTFTATVSAPSGASVALGGTVTFSDNGNIITSCGTAGAVTITWHSGSATGTAACATAGLVAGSHSVVATYSGDANYNVSNNNVSQSVSKGTSSTAIVSQSAGNTSTVNQAVTLQATITPSASPVPLSGTVTFSDGGNPVAGCVVSFSTSTGIASCTTSSLTLGSHTITATYANDSSYTGSNNNVTQSVTKGTSSVALVSSLPTAAVGQQVQFTATVTAQPSGTIGLGGSVSFTSDGNPINNCTAIAVNATTGIAPPCSISSLALGTHTIKATYANDNDFSGSNASIQQIISTASTSMVLTSSIASPTVNQPVTFTATLSTTPAGNTASLTGTVAFSDNGSTISGCGAVAPSSTGIANCLDPNLVASTTPHAIAAKYQNDSSFGSSNGNLNQTVGKGSTAVALATSGAQSTINQSVTFTATITPSPTGNVIPSGKVAFTDSVTGSAIPNCSSMALSQNGGVYTAACSTSSLALGAHTITATYGSDSNFTGNTGTVAQTVAAATAVITLTSSPSAVMVNQAVVLSASIPVASGSATPTGTVIFKDSLNGNSTVLCASVAPLQAGTSSNWVASCSVAGLAAGSHSLKASYGGDNNFSVSDGTTSLSVAQGSSSLVLTSSLNPSVAAVGNTAGFEDTVTFTAAITPSPMGVITLGTGTVAFTDNGNTISGCATAAVTGGKATCTTKTLGAGQHSINATYANDPNFTTSTSGIQQLVEDFSVAVSGVPAGTMGVIVTKGYTSSKDPFTPVTLSVSSSSVAGFSTSAGNGVALKCTSTAGAPACMLSSSGDTNTLNVIASGVEPSLTFYLDATSATPGTYTYTLTATDPTTSLAQSTTFTATVRAVSAALTVISGATSGNTESVTFNLPAGVTLSNFTCKYITGTGITGTTSAPVAAGVACTFGTPVVSGTTVTIPVTITTNSPITTGGLSAQRGFLPILFGLTLVGLLGLLRRKATRVGFFRVIILFAVGAGLLQTVGCGGSFSVKTTTVQGGTTPPGSYQLLIEATGSDGNTYSAVLELQVTL